MAWAEIATKFALNFASGGAQRHAAQMGADAKRDQPIFFARLGALGERLRVTQ
jgi:hypothetical protein